MEVDFAKIVAQNCNLYLKEVGVLNQFEFATHVMKKVNISCILFLILQLKTLKYLGQITSHNVNGDVTVRKVAEAAQTTFGSVYSVIDYSFGKLFKNVFINTK